MDQTQWANLELGAQIKLNDSTQDLIWAVAEIATDQRTLQNWTNHGHTVDKVVKLESILNDGTAVYTWMGEFNKWTIINTN